VYVGGRESRKQCSKNPIYVSRSVCILVEGAPSLKGNGRSLSPSTHDTSISTLIDVPISTSGSALTDDMAVVWAVAVHHR
jgi:hypothetical protein